MSQPNQEELYRRLIESLTQNWPALLLSLTSLGTGIWLILDDYKDFGKIDRPTHHVYTGVIPFIGGLLGFSFTLMKILSDIYPALKPAVKQATEMKQYSKEVLELMR